VYFAPLLKGFSLEFGTGAQSQITKMMELLGQERSLMISSALWIQCTNMTDGRTDGQTDTVRQQRPRLRIASRGKTVNSRVTSCCYIIFVLVVKCTYNNNEQCWGKRVQQLQKRKKSCFFGFWKKTVKTYI